jgi:hypothetical protein
MSKVPRSPYGNMTKDDILMTQQQTNKVLSGQVSFGKTAVNSTYQSPDQANIQTWKATGVTPGTPNVEFTVSHNFQWAPWFFQFITNNGGVIYQSRATLGTAATNSTQGVIFLKCTTASAAFTLMLF